ncbi:DUF2085 domain-containing protein [Halorussus halophilus]|uniref:DUF2085 domain-containing protein n=1 Tax=Halorussus halophilus TaxID=2650975 RepID=UPI001CE450FA|nr:DUF2085 domain-containing protein [Halorussus halophilus]
MAIKKVIGKIFRSSQVFRKYPLCHSRPDRSYCHNGRYFGLCARCTPLYLSGFFALLILQLGIWWPPDQVIGILFGIVLIIPGALDGVTQMFGNRESNNRLRTITGILMGVGVPTLIHSVFYIKG